MSKIASSGQMQFPMEELLKRELDRHFDKGGRSFYFFDFDDNVIHLPTRIVLFERGGDKELQVPTTEFALIQNELGRPKSEWEGWELRHDPVTGSFRNFREQPSLGPSEQPLIRDLLEALQQPFLEWRGPSWDFFAHAVNNNRPIAVITARGHHPHTIKRAINLMVHSRDLEFNPNYLAVYPVSYPETRRYLGDADERWHTAELKKAAIKAAVSDAFACYGESPYHRFGMSDDDPHNVTLIREAMRELKGDYKENAFFLFNTHGRQVEREEIQVKEAAPSESENVAKAEPQQISLF